MVLLDWYGVSEKCTLIVLNHVGRLFGPKFIENFDVGEQETYLLIVLSNFPSCIVPISFVYNYFAL